MPADHVFLTGATGFVGTHVLRALRAAGYHVRALVRGESRLDDCETVSGDLSETGSFARALDGCRFVVHCAALYSFAPAQRERMRTINVLGTAGLLEAARIAGVERAVVTSSSATLGPAHGDRLSNEADWATHSDHSAYHDSKLAQERAAFASRIPVVAVLPTAPIGPGDVKPTPTGEMIVNFARGRMFARPPLGGLNLVAVEDVAAAHVAALERGRSGERYVIGAENLTLDDVWVKLAAITGRPVPRWRAPYPLVLAIAYADELRCRMWASARPFAPLEGVSMARERMFVDSSKAERELGHRPGSVDAALERSVAWYREHGYLN